MICAFLGDSIALGLFLANPDCEVSARVGRSTHAIIAHQLPHKHYNYVVISAGSNNYKDPALHNQLERIRDGIDADEVVWAEPSVSRRARAMVRDVASEYGDLTQGYQQSRDGIHPRSYRILWNLIKEKITTHRPDQSQ